MGVCSILFRWNTATRHAPEPALFVMILTIFDLQLDGFREPGRVPVERWLDEERLGPAKRCASLLGALPVFTSNDRDTIPYGRPRLSDYARFRSMSTPAVPMAQSARWPPG
jgi:hypothetical protein